MAASHTDRKEENILREYSLLEEFTENMNERKEEILTLQRLYMLSKIENTLIQEQFNDICNEVLSEHPFYAECDCIREWNGIYIYKGDRIIAYNYQWLMSVADYKEFHEFCRLKWVEAGLISEDGNYTEKGNTEKRLMGVKSRLIRLAVSILPEEFPNRNKLEDAVHYKGCYSYKVREKLFELMMEIR